MLERSGTTKALVSTRHRGLLCAVSFFREMEGDLASTFLYLFEVTLSSAAKAGVVCGAELREKNRELGLI